jgi:hypothetical protein
MESTMEKVKTLRAAYPTLDIGKINLFLSFVVQFHGKSYQYSFNLP